MYDVFLSYARRDGMPLAHQLAKSLRQAGVSVFLDQDSIPAGENWERSLDSALESAVHILVILTPLSVKSEEVEAEWRPMLTKGKNVIPLLYIPCEIPRRLSMRQYIDFQDEAHYQLALTELLQAINTFSPTNEVQLSGHDLHQRAKSYVETGQAQYAVQDFIYLLNDGEERYRLSALRWLGQLKAPESLLPLIEKLTHEQSSIELFGVLQAIERIIFMVDWQAYAPNLIDSLLKLLQSSNTEIRAGVIKTLSYTRDANVIPAIVEAALYDTAPQVRSQAVIAIAKLAPLDASLVSVLQQIARQDREAAVRENARDALIIIQQIR